MLEPVIRKSAFGELPMDPTPVNMLRNGSAPAVRIAQNVNLFTHARLCYFSGLCSGFKAFLILFGYGPERTKETYVEIFSKLNIMSENDARLLSASRLTFVEKRGNLFVFRDEKDYEVNVSDLNELSKCKNLFSLIINNAASIEELNLSELINLSYLNIANCQRLKLLTFPTEINRLNEIHINGIAIQSLNIPASINEIFIEHCHALKYIISNSISCLRKLHACCNASLVHVDISRSIRCEDIDLSACPSLKTLAHTRYSGWHPSICLTGCPSLSSESRKSLNAIPQKRLYMDAELPIRSKPPDNDPYKILGVTRNATLNEIRKAYHMMSLRWHPDKNKSPDAIARFQEIVNAWEVLKNIKSRDIYAQRQPNARWN
jgi:hypothetical protein